MKSKSKLRILSIALTLLLCTGCAMQETSDTSVPDPFEINSSDNNMISDDIKENLAAENLRKYTKGGYECTINGGNPIVYNGEKIRVPVTITADKENECDMSLGISAVINGTAQTLSSGGMKDGNMLIFENIAPGETAEREITFEPVISSEDKDCKQLPITFFSHFNAAYVPDESYPTFGMTHNAFYSLYTTVSFEAKPKAVDYSYISDVKKKLITQKLLDEKYTHNTGNVLNPKGTARIDIYQDYKTDTGVLRLNNDKTLTFNLLMYVSEGNNGKYRISLYKNDERIPINQSDYIETELSAGYLYTYTVKLDNINRGDFIYAEIHKNTGEHTEEFVTFDMTSPHLVVNSDFTVNVPETSAQPETSQPQESKPQEAPSDNGAVYKGDVLNIELVGYTESDGKRLAVIRNNRSVYVSDIDENKRISDVITLDEFEKQGYETNTLTADGRKIVMEKYTYNGDEVTSAEYCIFDSFLTETSTVPMQKDGEYFSESGIVINGTQKLTHEYINDTLTLCVCDYNGDNKKPLYSLPNNSYDYSLSADSELIFFRVRSDSSDTETAVVVNIKDGSTVTYNGNVLTKEGNLTISSEGNYILFPDSKSTSGKLLIYDKTKKSFREITTKYNCEGNSSTALSPDGKYILTSVSEISAVDGKTPTGTYLRVYDTQSGELYREEKINDKDLKTGGTLLVGNDYAIVSTINGDFRIKYRS